MPTLPPGHAVQVAWRIQHGLRTYEFFYVYDERNRLDPGRSYWLCTPLDCGDAPPLRAVSWRRHRLASVHPGRFTDFSSPSVPIDVLERWLAEGPPAEGVSHRVRAPLPHAT